MGRFSFSGVTDAVSKAFKPVRKISQKIIPKEIRPALPFLAAAVPFMLPGSGIASLPFANNPGFQRALLSSMANLGAQAAADPEGEDLNLLSAGIAGLTGALGTDPAGTAQGVSGKAKKLFTSNEAIRGTGFNPGDALGGEMLTGASPVSFDTVFGGVRTPIAEPGLIQGIKNITGEGVQSLRDIVTGSRDTLSGFGSDPKSLFSKEGAKAAGKAIVMPTAQAVGDLGYTTATAALRDFQKAEAEELAAAGADEAAIANARRAAIREAMEVSGFGEEDILDTFDEIGLKEGGRVGYARGKIVKEGLAALKKIRPGGDIRGFPITTSKGSVIKNPQDKFSEEALKKSQYQQDLKRFNEGISDYDPREGLAGLKVFRRPKFASSDEAKMTFDLIKTGRYTEDQLLKLDGDQIAEIYEYEGFTVPKPIEGSSKIIDMEEMIKNVTPEDMASGGIARLKDGGMLDFDGREMDLRGGGFVPIGKKEKADDVPARLSKNEFVMTADAVRAAGGGSVNKGAQRMYNLMNQLEARA